MQLFWAVLPLGFLLGGLLAFAVGGMFLKHLHDASKHENTLLPFLHIFWILCVAGFALYAAAYF